MSISLPGPISAYLKAQNAHDIDAMLAPFDEDALSGPTIARLEIA